MDNHINKPTEDLRLRTNACLSEDSNSTLVISGPCSWAFEQTNTMLNEAKEIDDINRTVNAIVALHRIPPWKPRTVPTEWSGPHTENSELTKEILTKHSNKFGNVAIEIGDSRQFNLYGNLISFGWIGARNLENIELKRMVVESDKKLAVGIKNGLDGNIDEALRQVDNLNKLRTEDDAPVVMIFRGGTRYKDATSWEKGFLEVFHKTAGNFIVDIAHGGEMAHDRDAGFKKSIRGQFACLEHLGNLIIEGFRPKGIILEASNAESYTDPVIPFYEAWNSIFRKLFTSDSNNTINITK